MCTGPSITGDVVPASGTDSLPPNQYLDQMPTRRTSRPVCESALNLLLALDLSPTISVNENNQRSDMLVQTATPDALEAIRSLLSTLDLPYRDLTPSHVEHFLVCRDGDEIVGVVGLELYGQTALLRSLAVHPSHRNRGIGSRLIEEIEQYGLQRGAHDIYLLTTTASEYFVRHGYEIVGRDELPKAIQETEEAAQLCPSSATRMRKNLATTAGNPL